MLLNLTSRDVDITETKKGPVLSIKLQNYAIVLYYTTKCEYCKPLLEVFKRLSTVSKKCAIGILNLTNNMEVVIKSRQTQLAIESVPLIIFYVNGTPFVKYDGQRDINSIMVFINQMCNDIKSSQQSQFISQNDSIPEYTVGRPKSGGGNRGVCYLTFNDDVGYKK